MRFTNSTCAISALVIASCAAPSAQSEIGDQVQGHWMTEDSALVVEITACEEGSSVLCGFIRALPGAKTDTELARYAAELCNLPLLSNLTLDEAKSRWSGGDIFDPETEQMYAVYIQRKPDHLKVRAFEGSEWMGETLMWTAFEGPVDDCLTTGRPE